MPLVLRRINSVVGIQQFDIEHRRTFDRRTLVELHRVLREELRANGIGELEGDLERADPWPIDQDASHHMGATRMGTDPRSSVVDVDLRLHAAENVWIAGSSVFPASGCANPTYTIVALVLTGSVPRQLSHKLTVSFHPHKLR